MSFDLYQKSYEYLNKGDYRTGFKLFEHRWDPSTQLEFPDRYQFKKLVPQPVWRGEDLYGKSITVQMEMGYGDCIQFARFLPYLKMCGAKKLVVLQTASLHNLMSQISCIDSISNNDKEGDAVETDYWIGSMSLPYFIIHSKPSLKYLFPIDKQYVIGRDGYFQANKRDLDGKIKIGVNWSSSFNWKHDITSISDTEIEKLSRKFPDITFYSFNPLSEGPFHKLPTTDWHNDWAITAEYIKSMNAMITVDTGTVHLAGSLGVPTFLLQPEHKYICWRWKFNNWYSSVKSFYKPSLNSLITYLKGNKNGLHT